MQTKKFKISIFVIALIALPFIFSGCFLDELFSCSSATEYSVTYELNAEDATFSEGEVNPETYWSNTSKYLYSPRREGYVFLGWYEHSDFSGWAWSSIPKGTKGDLILYAKWGEEGEAIFWEGFLPYKTKFDGAKKGTKLTINSREELSAYLEYVQYNYVKADINGVRIELSYNHTNVQQEISDAHDSLSYGSCVGLSYSKSTPAYVGILYDNLITAEASKTAVTNDYYTQIQPYEYNINGNVHEFAIDDIETELECITSNQLFYAAQVGVKPVPENGSAAERIYNSARDALTEAVNENMTDAEKVTAIYDWLVMNVTYDYNVLQYSSDVKVAAEYDAFYLEGVFDTGRAVCDGISKAMTLMCRIEGIPCVRVIGDGHAWNKVFVDGSWYIADATYGDTAIVLNRTDYSFMNHQYLLVSENTVASSDNGNQITYCDKAKNYLDDNYYALTDYGYYSKKKFYVGDTEYDFVITSKSEYNTMYNWAQGLGYRGPYSVDFYTESRSYLGSGRFTSGDHYVTVFFNM